MENVLVRGAASPKPGSTRIDFAQLVIVLFVGIFALMCMLPFVLLIVISFTDDAAIIENGYSFFPEMLSLSAYRTMSIVYVTVIAVTSPFGWLAGILSEIHRILPFLMNIALFGIGCILTYLSGKVSRYKNSSMD